MSSAVLGPVSLGQAPVESCCGMRLHAVGTKLGAVPEQVFWPSTRRAAVASACGCMQLASSLAYASNSGPVPEAQQLLRDAVTVMAPSQGRQVTDVVVPACVLAPRRSSCCAMRLREIDTE